MAQHYDWGDSGADSPAGWVGGGDRSSRVRGRGCCLRFYLPGNIRTSSPSPGCIRDDYRAAGFKMLPVVEPTGERTFYQAMAFSMCLDCRFHFAELSWA